MLIEYSYLLIHQIPQCIKISYFVNTHHCADKYKEAFPDSKWQGIPIIFRYEPILLDTAGGIKNIEDLIGANGQIQILQTKRGGIVYGNVQAILPLGRGMVKMEVPSDYVRQVERDQRAGLEKEPDGAASDRFAEEEPGDDSIPF